MPKIRLQMAPELELNMEMDVEGVDVDSRDWDVQQHKAEIYAEFERRLKAAFPEGVTIHTFQFGQAR